MNQTIAEFEVSQQQQESSTGISDIDILRHILRDFPSAWETNKAFLRDKATPNYTWMTNSCLVILRNLEDHIIRTDKATSREALELNRLLREIFYESFNLHPVLRVNPTKAVEALQEQYDSLPEAVRMALESEGNQSIEEAKSLHDYSTYPWRIDTENMKSNRVSGISASTIFQKLQIMHNKMDDKIRSLLIDIESRLDSANGGEKRYYTEKGTPEFTHHITYRVFPVLLKTSDDLNTSDGFITSRALSTRLGVDENTIIKARRDLRVWSIYSA